MNLIVIPRGKFFMRMRAFLVLIAAIIFSLSPTSLSDLKAQSLSKSENEKGPLKFDAIEKSQATKSGDKEAIFKFTATNITNESVVIENVQTSCGCTSVIKKNPWIIRPGAKDLIEVKMDLLGRTGTVTKSVYVFTNAGAQTLKVRSIIPPGKKPSSKRSREALSERQKNQIIALRDRQIVFRGKCAKCHSTPTKGLTGKKLYDRACGICHNSPNQASIVPNLAKLDKTMDKFYWEVWIKYGRKGSLMPAFHKSQGGPLDDKQVSSLVDYLLTNKPTETIRIPKEVMMENEKVKKQNGTIQIIESSELGKFNALRPISDPRLQKEDKN